jgi:hypothetical protein
MDGKMRYADLPQLTPGQALRGDVSWEERDQGKIANREFDCLSVSQPYQDIAVTDALTAKLKFKHPVKGDLTGDIDMRKLRHLRERNHIVVWRAARRREQRDLCVVKMLADEMVRGIAAVPSDDRQIGLPSLRGVERVLRLRDVHNDVHPGPLDLKKNQRRRKQIGAGRHAGGNHQRASRPVLDAGDISLHLEAAGQGFLGPAVHPMSGRRKYQATSDAHEPLGADPLLQRPQLTRNGRLSDEEMLGGSCDAPLFDDEAENLETTQRYASVERLWLHSDPLMRTVPD